MPLIWLIVCRALECPLSDWLIAWLVAELRVAAVLEEPGVVGLLGVRRPERDGAGADLAEADGGGARRSGAVPSPSHRNILVITDWLTKKTYKKRILFAGHWWKIAFFGTIFSIRWSTFVNILYNVLYNCYIYTINQGQIEYRSRIENWRILWVTSPGDSTALSQFSYIWPAELRNLHSQTFILEMLPSITFRAKLIGVRGLSLYCESAERIRRIAQL